MTAQLTLTSRHAPTNSTRHPDRFAWGLCLAVAAIVAVMVWSPGPAEQDKSLRVSRLVHWQDARHDWLLVADRASHELVVYDAVSGAPLQRLGAQDGLGEIDTIAQSGDRLMVQGERGPSQVLTLPALQPDTLAAR